MHIGFITSHFPFHDSKSVGGIGTSIKNLSDGLVNLGHTVSVFVYGQETDKNFIEDNLKIYKIKNVKFKGLSWFLTRKKIETVISRVNDCDALDIVEAPDWEGITSFIKTRCPLVIRLNGSDTYFCHLDGRKVKLKNKFHEKRALEKADGIISVSQYTGDLTNKVFNLQKEIVVIPNGINLKNFQPKPGVEKSQVILYFGGIIRKKGVLEIPHYFNRVIQKIPKTRMILIGKDMPDKISGNASTLQMMEGLFSDEALKRVAFLGSVPYQEIKKHINNATVCIFPSYAEAMPVSWLEAMALEKAIVASNIGWSNEIIEEGVNGFKVQPDKHDDFAKRIVMLLENEELRKMIEINAGRTIAAKFSTEVTAIQSIKFYNDIIAQYND